jgi:hypothetical protein
MAMTRRFTRAAWRLLEGIAHALRHEDLLQSARTAP